MRVAVVCPYDLGKWGGVQRQAVELAEELRGRGNDAWVVGPGRTGPGGARLIGRSVPVPANGSVAPICLTPWSVRPLMRAVADADVVHVHEPLMPVASLATVTMARRPVVGTFHAAPGPTGELVYRSARPLLRRLFARMAVVTAVSSTAAEPLRGLVDEVQLIPNAVNVDGYRAPAVERVAGRVVFVGRDEPRKGLDVLLEAWPTVRNARPDAELVVIGSRRGDLPGGVVGAGQITEHDKRLMLASAEVFVAPNLGGESFGITLVEGLAAGCRVVASALPAFTEVLGGTGRLVPPGDPQALAEALADELGDGVAAPSHLFERAGRFDWSVVLPLYLQAYGRALM